MGKKKGSNFASQFGREINRKDQQKNDSVAQLVEQMTLNHWVVGSSPTGVTESRSKCFGFFIIQMTHLAYLLALGRGCEPHRGH